VETLHINTTPLIHNFSFRTNQFKRKASSRIFQGMSFYRHFESLGYVHIRGEHKLKTRPQPAISVATVGLTSGYIRVSGEKNWKIELVWVVSGGLGFEKWKSVVSIPARDTLVLESHITVLHTAQAPALLPLPLLHGKAKSNYLFPRIYQ